MAREIAELAASITEKPQFCPKPWYNEAGDCVQFYFDNTESYRERIDSGLTLYRSLRTDEIVGCQIKGVKALLSRLGGPIVVRHKELPFAVLLFMSHFESEASPFEPRKRRKIYDAVLNKTGGSQVEFPDMSTNPTEVERDETAMA